MKLPTVLLTSARLPQCETKVPFQEILALKLKNRVSGKADSENSVSCLQEMAVFFACMKNNDFNESMCSKEIGTFQKCYKTFLDNKSAAKIVQNQGTLKAGKDLNSRQINMLFKKFPHPK